MTKKQRAMLQKLIEAYARRSPADVAAHELEQVKKAGLDRVHFAFAQDQGPRRGGSRAGPTPTASRAPRLSLSS